VENNAGRGGSSAEGLYRLLPSVNDLLLTDDIAALVESRTRSGVVSAARKILERMRNEIAQGLHSRTSLLDGVAALPAAIAEELSRPYPYSLRRVINATGVILHTNLGRAPLSKPALKHLVQVARGYSNLEFDLESGERGKRDVHVESLILALLGNKEDFAETHRAIVVNNCAAATFLALHVLAQGKDVIVSRGELVEIGGGFRIPEIMKESGAIMREVGTTNRTHLADYEDVISSNTGLILRVHQSNFSMDGFVARPGLEELVGLGKRAGVPVFEDQGTGLLHSLEPYGIHGEVTVMDSLGAGCDLVAASGDKLLGGPQCGVLIGRKGLIEKIRKSPLFRALRVDKLTYAALEGTLAQYLCGASEAIPTVRMLKLEPQQIKSRCEQIVTKLVARGLTAEVVPVESLIGGGTTPKAKLQSYAIALKHSSIAADSLLSELRRCETPVIARINDECVLLDLRTVDADSDQPLVEMLNKLSVAERAQAEPNAETVTVDGSGR